MLTIEIFKEKRGWIIKAAFPSKEYEKASKTFQRLITIANNSIKLQFNPK